MEIYYDQLRLAYSKIFHYYLNNLANIRTKLRCRMKPYDCARPMQLPSSQTEFEFIKMLDNKAGTLIQNDAHKHLRVTKLLMYVNSEHNATIKDLLGAYYDLCAFNIETLNSLKVDDENIVGIVPRVHQSDQITIDDVNHTSMRVRFNFDKTTEAYDENEFIESAMIAWQTVLRENRQPTPNEYLMVHLAYNILKSNASSNYSLNKNFAGMGTPGFRAYTQTYMSLTDPGPGHIFGKYLFISLKEQFFARLEKELVYQKLYFIIWYFCAYSWTMRYSLKC